MIKGQEAEVITLGNNRKCHVSGSLVWYTATLLVSRPDADRNADLFVSHLDDLRRCLRCLKRIDEICINARSHNCQKVWEYLQQRTYRLVLHFLHRSAPETSPIERIWWHRSWPSVTERSASGPPCARSSVRRPSNAAGSTSRAMC
ncbi:MAG: transposase [Planctomycetaceae bacterium]|nr:transposase [Planctomycetaceae bacterium]